MKKKVLVAMSGGVDSSTAAYLLKKEGYEVAGITMCLGVKDRDRRKPACCGSEAIKDARKVCDKLGIPHYVLDFSKHLEKEVINNFVSEYLKGRTPNPCVDCNRSLKFGILLKKALSLGFDFLATGHYAKIEKDGKSYILKKAKDRTKDQSYFLYAIPKTALKFVLFPLGKYTKNQVRNIARKANIPVADKQESQDICFIPERNYHGFISDRMKKIPDRGSIVDLNGKALGTHKGAAFYTIGQRGGLGVGYKHPLYVLSIDTRNNRLVVGDKRALRSEGLMANRINFLVKNLPKKARAKIRYNNKEEKCEIIRNKQKIKVTFNKPQQAITPGQSVVLYERDVVLGGGVIDEVSNGGSRWQ